MKILRALVWIVAGPAVALMALAGLCLDSIDRLEECSARRRRARAASAKGEGNG